MVLKIQIYISNVEITEPNKVPNMLWISKAIGNTTVVTFRISLCKSADLLLVKNTAARSSLHPLL